MVNRETRDRKPGVVLFGAAMVVFGIIIGFIVDAVGAVPGEGKETSPATWMALALSGAAMLFGLGRILAPRVPGFGVMSGLALAATAVVPYLMTRG